MTWGPMSVRHNKRMAPARDGDLRPEYDFASMTGGVRGKYVARLRKESKPRSRVNRRATKAKRAGAARG
jgi:hypothetical protein